MFEVAASVALLTELYICRCRSLRAPIILEQVQRAFAPTALSPQAPTGGVGLTDLDRSVGRQPLFVLGFVDRFVLVGNMVIVLQK